MVDNTLRAPRSFSIQTDRSEISGGLFRSFETYFMAYGLYVRQTTGKRKLGYVIHNVYCAIIILLVWFDMARYLTIFQTFKQISDRKMAALTVTVFHITICLNSSTNFYALRKYFPGFVKELDDYLLTYGLDINQKKSKGRIKGLFLVFSCFFVLGALGLSLYLVLVPMDKDLLLLHHYTPFQTFSNEIFYPMIFLLNITNGYGVAHLFGTVFFYCYVCYVIGSEYRRVSRTLDIMIENGKTSEIAEGFEDVRRQHEMISKVLDSCSHILHHIVFFIYASGIPIVCLAIYGVISGSLPMEDIGSLIEYFGLVVIGMVTITGAGALVNSLVR